MRCEPLVELFSVRVAVLSPPPKVKRIRFTLRGRVWPLQAGYDLSQEAGKDARNWKNFANRDPLMF